MPLSGCQTRLTLIILKGVKIEPESAWSWPLTPYVVTTKRQACNIVPGPLRLTGDEWAARALGSEGAGPRRMELNMTFGTLQNETASKCQINYTDLKSVKDAQ